MWRCFRLHAARPSCCRAHPACSLHRLTHSGWARALIDGVSRPWRSHDEAPPLEHAAWLDWFEPGNGGRPPSAARRPRPNDTTARAPQNKINGSRPRGRGVTGYWSRRRPAAEAFDSTASSASAADYPSARARRPSLRAGSGPGLRSGRGGCVFGMNERKKN